MQVIRTLCGLWTGMAIATAADQAAPAQPRPLSLEDCLQIAIKHNLDVQIVRVSPEIARYRLGMSYAGYDPNLFLVGSHAYRTEPDRYDPTYNNIGGSRFDLDAFRAGVQGDLPFGMRWELGANTSETWGLGQGSAFKEANAKFGDLTLTQPLLRNFLIDSIRYTILVNKNGLKISELDLRMQIIRTLTSVERAYYDLIFARENVTVYLKALELANRLLVENKKWVEVGAMAALDEKQAESQVAARRAEVLSARQQLTQRQNALKSLLIDNFSEWKNASVEPTESLAAPVPVFSRQDSWHKGMTQRPDLLKNRQQIELQNINLRYYKNQMLPQLDLVASLGSSGGGARDYGPAWNQISDNRNPNYMYGAQLSMPLTNRRARSQYQQGLAEKKQALLQLKKMEQDILFQIDDAIDAAQTAYERVDATKQARVYAEEALKTEQKKLEAGKSTSFIVLSLQRDLTNARSTEISALAEYNKALAELALQEGSTLARHRIQFQVK